MFQSAYPKFEKGRLLKIEMLETLRDYPRDIFNVFVKNSGNGILTGCEINVQENELLIQPGIIYFDENFYVLKKPYGISYLSNNRLTICKVRCLNGSQEQDFIRTLSQIYLDYHVECQDNEIELCRFQLREGASLRNNHTDFYDFNTEYDTINRIYAPYVYGENKTLAPEILVRFAKEARAGKNLEPSDISFIYLVLQNHGLVEREVIISYLMMKEMNVKEDCSNIELYKSLTMILRSTLSQREAAKENSPFRGAILLD